MKAIIAVALGSILAATAAFADDREDRIDVTVEGDARPAQLWRVDGRGGPAKPDDVVQVGAFMILRGSEPTLALRWDEGRLWLIGADGKEKLVGAVAAALLPGQDPDKDLVDEDGTHVGQKPEKDTIAALSDAEIQGLRGVRVVHWSGAVARSLARVHLDATCLFVANTKNEAIPPLPKGTRYLAFAGGTSNQGPGSLEPLAGLEHLRFLALGWRFQEATDLAPLAALGELESLDLSCREISHPETLGRLGSLRTLGAAACKGLGDIAFAKGVAGLRVIDVSDTTVADLSPLSDHAELRVISADKSKASILPGGALPALRSLRILSAPIAPAIVEAFQKAHPACEVAFSRRGLLLAALKGVNRIRVRTGGTCHRKVAEEKSLAELKTAEEIRSILDLLRFDDAKDFGECMCCGNPTFEFYAGEALKASLGFHHGQTLRWIGGEWPGDAWLTPEAGEALARWVAAHGEPEPLKELETSRREEEEQRAVTKDRDDRLAALLPKDLREALQGTARLADDESVRAVFAKAVPDATARVRLAFTILGIAAEMEGEGVPLAAVRTLRAEPIDVVTAGARKALEDVTPCRGVGFWLFLERGWKALDAATLDEILPTPARRLLSDLDPAVRYDAIRGLRSAARPASIDLLRKMLAGNVLGAEISGAAPVAPETPDILYEAAVALIQLGDRESIPRIRALAPSWDEEKRKQIEVWISGLEKSADGK